MIEGDPHQTEGDPYQRIAFAMPMSAQFGRAFRHCGDAQRNHPSA
jgi:hypothetical protein